VFERIIETIITISELGMSYNKTQNEASRSLRNTNIDHETFLELTLLISMFDPILKSHLDYVTTEALKNISNENTNIGRGNLVSFLSKIAVINLIQILK